MRIEAYRNAQAVVAVPRNCCRCGADFMDHSIGRPARICQACRAPKRKTKELKPLLGQPLSPREKQVCEGMRWGKSYKAIAWELKLAPGTVKVYASRIFDKTGMANKVTLAVWWALTEQVN